MPQDKLISLKVRKLLVSELFPGLSHNSSTLGLRLYPEWLGGLVPPGPEIMGALVTLATLVTETFLELMAHGHPPGLPTKGAGTGCLQVRCRGDTAHRKPLGFFTFV